MEKQVKMSREMMYYSIRYNSVEQYRMYLYIQNHPNFYVDSDGRRNFSVTALANELGIARKTAYIHLEKLLKRGWLRFDTKQQTYFISSHKRLIRDIRKHIGFNEWGQIGTNLNRDNYHEVMKESSSKSKMFSMRWEDFVKHNTKKSLKSLFIGIFINENIKQQVYFLKKKNKFGEIVNRKLNKKTVKADFESFVSGVDTPSKIHLSVKKVSDIFSKKSLATGLKYRKAGETTGLYYTRTNACFLGKDVDSHYIDSIKDSGYHIFNTKKGWYVNGASFVFPCSTENKPFNYYTSKLKI